MHWFRKWCDIVVLTAVINFWLFIVLDSGNDFGNIRRQAERLRAEIKCKSKTTSCLDMLDEYAAMRLLTNCINEVNHMGRTEKNAHLTAKVSILFPCLQSLLLKINWRSSDALRDIQKRIMWKHAGRLDTANMYYQVILFFIILFTSFYLKHNLSIIRCLSALFCTVLSMLKYNVRWYLYIVEKWGDKTSLGVTRPHSGIWIYRHIQTRDESNSRRNE